MFGKELKTALNNNIPKEDIDNILKHANTAYRPIFILAIETGFRIDDLLKMRRYQAKNPLTLKEKKTQKTRTVELPPSSRIIIEKLLKKTTKKNPYAYVFQTKTQKHNQKRQKLHRSTVYRQFTGAVKRAGLNEKGYTVHSLRKVYARNLFKKTNSITAVQQDMNHDNIATTLLYLTDIN